MCLLVIRVLEKNSGRVNADQAMGILFSLPFCPVERKGVHLFVHLSCHDMETVRLAVIDVSRSLHFTDDGRC